MQDENPRKRVRQTSVAAFKAIKENGLLSERRYQVYEILFEHGPATGAEVARYFNLKHGRTGASETIRNRITELRDMGCVEEVGQVVDPHTEMTVTLWDVTSNLPVKFDRPVRHRCPTCNGKGYVSEQQAKLF